MKRKKRFSLIFLGALAMILMAGCSKNGPEIPDEDAWVHDLSLPVPIQFGSGLPVTKASGFEDPSDLDGIIIGVWGLAKNEGAVWGKDMSEDVILNNKAGAITDGSIELDGGPYYYPRVSEKNFTFYGYYPKKTPTTVEDGSLYVEVSLGHTDIVWAKSEAKGNGYNAKYLRDIRTHKEDDVTPVFNFEHVTAGLKFNAVANLDGGAHKDDDFTTTKIKKVRVLNVPLSGMLCVASQTNPELEGTITQLGSISNIKLDEIDEAVGKSPTEHGTELGELFLYPDSESDGFDVEVTVGTKAWGDYVYKFNTGKLSPKTKYTFNLLFNYEDPVKIKVGTLTWTEGTKDKTIDMSEDGTSGESPDA